MILILDNYDSFTYNLVQYIGELRQDIVVHRNDHISTDEIAAMQPDHIVISPGPCTPNEAGISVELVERFSGHIPILGVCLGHQAIGQAFGGKIVHAKTLMHGKTSMIHHDGSGVFANLLNPFEATRYHSLAVERETMPQCFRVTAWTDDGEIMGIEHTAQPTYGVQFHPESILTASGKQLLRNFLNTALAISA